MSKAVDKSKNEFFASCPSGLEEILLKEVQSLDPKASQQVRGGVEFTALPEIAIELLFKSRVASRVYKKLYSFDIKSEKDLYYFSKEIKWKAIFGLDQTFKINVVQNKSPDGKKRSQFDNTMFLGQKLKDAIVDRFREDCKGERPSVEKHHPDLTFLLHLEPHNNPFASKEKATILLDMCGRPLSQRGYKVADFKAPLRENLAAGLISKIDDFKPEIFIDAMCGSGTFLVEALLIHANIPPVYLNLDWIASERKFWDLENQYWFEKSDYLKEQFGLMIKRYQDLTDSGFTFLDNMETPFIGNDIDRDALQAAKENLIKAKLENYVSLEVGDALNLESEFDKGIIVANPPYGERLGQKDDLVHLYHELGETFKHKFKGFRAYVLTGNIPLLKKISLRTSQKHIVFNGNIESRWAEYELF